MNHETKLLTLIAAIPVVIALASFVTIYADDIQIIGGYIYEANLDTNSVTSKWAGVVVTFSGNPTVADSDPLLTQSLPSSGIVALQFDGHNYKNVGNFYAATKATTFDPSNLRNTTQSDLNIGGMFNPVEFGVFYPDYDSYSDNPKTTFILGTTQVIIEGNNYTALKTQIGLGNDYYVLKYDNNGSITPVFLSEINDTVCYDGTDCGSEFMLPIGNKAYNFFIVTKYPSVDFSVTIDGTNTTTFDQTAMPYVVTVHATSSYTKENLDNITLIIAETSGQNLFIPASLSGYLSEAYTIGKTDASGYESFFIAPTVYPHNDDYEIYVGAIYEGVVASKEVLFIAEENTLNPQPKSVPGTTLPDNAKTTITSLVQISSKMFELADQKKVKKLRVEYELTNDTYEVIDLQTGLPGGRLNTGAPNLIRLVVQNNGIPVGSTYYGQIKEIDGFLVMNPTTGSTDLTYKNRTHEVLLPSDTDFVITATSLGFISSTVTMDVSQTSGGAILGTVTIPIIADLNQAASSTSNYDDDAAAENLKTMVNRFSQITDSLYVAVN